MRTPSLIPSMAILLAVAACASPDAARESTPEAQPTVELTDVTDDVPASPAADAAGALWGDPVLADTTELRKFVAQAAESPGDGLTRTVSATNGSAASEGHEVRALRLRDGTLLAGRLVGDDGSAVEFAFETPDGVKGTTRVAYAGIHPESVAELMLARADQGDAGALLDIAEFAAGEGLYEVARVHYLAAAEQDEAVEGIVERRLQDLADRVSDAELARAAGAVEQGHDTVARRILRRVQREFAGTPAADDAAAAIAEIDARTAALELDATREKQIAPIRKLLDEAGELTSQGLRQAHKPSTAIRSYMLSRSKANAARRRLPTARRAGERSADDELLSAVDELGARVDEQEIDNETHLASAYLDKGDFTRARQAANAVLALDRDNREALSLLGQIRSAEEERRRDTYDAYWYRYRRHHGVYPYPRRWYPRRGAGWGTIRRGGTYTRAPIGVFRR